MNELLQKLTEATGVSSQEKEIRLLIKELIEPHVAEWRVDALGNLFGFKKGTGELDMTVLVDAHMDEVGLMVTDVDSDGTLKFDPVGGFDPRALLGKMVVVGPKKLTGVIGTRPIHLSSAAQRSTMVPISDMRIDIGASKKENATSKVNVGDMAAFATEYRELGEVAIGKAFDNRAGCAALIELLRGEPYPFDLVAAFTVQEEVGLKGAQVAGYDIRPDLALILECTPAYDLPTDEDISPNVALGKGPSVYVMDSHTIQDPRFVAHIIRTATERGIPYQLRQPGGGGTNAGAYQPLHGSIPVATIATPGRYAHSPAMMINLQDYADVVRLADATLRNLSAELFARE
ncbi:MAG: M20/M25/M40 family metallo-hydrolase [Anaerolineales bacterium]|nr:M20/M25/M40 family metallo-hydrolase [Anaerolineales bacterium]MCB0006263.1 M20/M25/M40 family metallo-hydrolase [Anaerolineales bacterium]MCB0030592.1 M20/M25/M40 family metallo-hydrolase [Anaerolineales bacterium]